MFKRVYLVVLLLAGFFPTVLFASNKEPVFIPAKNPDPSLPRVLLMGDSICNMYQERVVELLNGKADANVWITRNSLNDPGLSKERGEMLSHGPMKAGPFIIRIL